MQEIYLIRHWQSEWNSKNVKQWLIDYKLTEEWILQVKSLLLLKDLKNIDLFFSSDYKRAYETAKLLSNWNDIIVDKRLREWNVFPEKNNYKLTPENRKKINPYLLRYEKTKKYWQWESFLDIHNRLYDFLKDNIFNKHHKKIVIVSHAWTINHLIYLFLFGKNNNANLHYYFITKFSHIKNASVTKIIFKENSYKIDYFNLVNY